MSQLHSRRTQHFSNAKKKNPTFSQEHYSKLIVGTGFTIILHRMANELNHDDDDSDTSRQNTRTSKAINTRTQKPLQGNQHTAERDMENRSRTTGKADATCGGHSRQPSKRPQWTRATRIPHDREQFQAHHTRWEKGWRWNGRRRTIPEDWERKALAELGGPGIIQTSGRFGPSSFKFEDSEGEEGEDDEEDDERRVFLPSDRQFVAHRPRIVRARGVAPPAPARSTTEEERPLRITLDGLSQVLLALSKVPTFTRRANSTAPEGSRQIFFLSSIDFPRKIPQRNLKPFS